MLLKSLLGRSQAADSYCRWFFLGHDIEIPLRGVLKFEHTGIDNALNCDTGALEIMLAAEPFLQIRLEMLIEVAGAAQFGLDKVRTAFAEF